MSNHHQILSSETCWLRMERAKVQAKEEAMLGKEHAAMLRACIREWQRRHAFAVAHNGVWDSWEYEMAKENQ